ncbi:MAG: hypothetical protein ACREN5_10585 [Gemmatimonadales bacterium]
MVGTPVATTVIRAVTGGTAEDEAGGLRVSVPPHALAVDVAVTIVAEAVVVEGWKTVASWRVIAHPAPLVLAYPATLAAAVPLGAEGHALLVSEDDGWQAIGATAADGKSVEAQPWYLPPTHGPPPRLSSALVCLARRA